MCSVKSLGCGLMQVFRLKRICFQGLGQEGKVWKGREVESVSFVCVGLQTSRSQQTLPPLWVSGLNRYAGDLVAECLR